MAIHLGRSLPNASRDRPERQRGRLARRRGPRPAPPAAPTWSCSRWGLPCRRRCRRRGALLPHHFTLAARRPEGRHGLGGVFLWHFPWGRPRRALPGTVLPWSPDFPPSAGRTGEERPSDRLAGKIWDGAPRLSNGATVLSEPGTSRNRSRNPVLRSIEERKPGGFYERSPRSSDRAVTGDDRRWA